MTSHTNEALLRRFYDEAFGKGKLSMVDEQFDRNFVEHEPLPPEVKPGPEGIKQLISALRMGFPDLQVAVHGTVSQGDKVWAHVTLSGTHKGAFMNIPPTQRPVTVQGATFITLRNGRIHRVTRVWDVAGLLRSLGLLPEL